MMAADRPYGEYYDFYSVSPEYFGYHPVFSKRQNKILLPFLSNTPVLGQLFLFALCTADIFYFVIQAKILTTAKFPAINTSPQRMLNLQASSLVPRPLLFPHLL
jgi:hypothetical protein